MEVGVEVFPMTDIVSPEIRARMMRANRRRDTKPEMLVRRHLHAAGFRFRLDVGKLPGRPDIVLARHRAAIFVHGCFWHRHEGCRFTTMPKSNTAFWSTKFSRNVERDRGNVAALRSSGWRVGIVWECGLRKSEMASTLSDLAAWLHSDAPFLEVPRPS